MLTSLDVLRWDTRRQDLGTAQMQGDVRRFQGMQQQPTGLGMVMGFRGRQQLDEGHESVNRLPIVTLEVGRRQAGLHADGGNQGIRPQVPRQCLRGQDRKPAWRDHGCSYLAAPQASCRDRHTQCQAGSTQYGYDGFHHCPCWQYRPRQPACRKGTQQKRCHDTSSKLFV